jgi:phage gp29-like protein
MIVDTNGNPISSEDLKSPQTDDAKLGHLHKHYAAHPSKGLTPAKLASILLAAEQGDIIAQCELAEDMEEKDGHIFSELQKRRLCMKSVPWKIVPPRNANAAELKDTEMLQEQFEDMTFLGDLIFDMSDAILKGFSNSEIEWHQEEKLWLPKQIEFKDPSWFMANPDNRNELRLRDNSANGAELQPFGWIQHIHKTKSGYLSRNGLARVLAWPFIFKNFSVRDLAEFNEIYGLPLRLGKYPTGASKTEKATLLRAVMSIGHNAGGIIPKGMDIEFQEAAKGTQQPFECMVSLMEKTVSKAVLGGTLTSQADGKSSTNALGNVHNEVRQELRDSDLGQIANTLTRDVVLPMYMFNGRSYHKPSRSPRFEFDITEAEDLKLFSESLPPLVDTGVPIPVSWVQGKLQIPEPKDGEAILMPAGIASDKAAAPNEKLPGTQLKTINKITALKAKASKAKPEELDSFTKQLGNNMNNSLKTFTSEVQQLVEQATSLEELSESLASLDLNIDEATEVMQQAFFASELSGMYDVEQESE